MTNVQQRKIRETLLYSRLRLIERRLIVPAAY